MKKIDLNQIRRIHFVGIKGVAMAALAIWAKERGWIVSGSDLEEEFPTDHVLKKNGIRWNADFRKENIPENVDLVIVTGAHNGINNIEAQTAIKRNIPTVMQGEALGLFIKGKKGIAVAGSHGKTTTSALVAHLLTKTGKDCSYIVGCGGIDSLGNPAHYGKGEFFVAEADEYINCPNVDLTPKFLFLNQHISLITNIEYDHPDAYTSLQQVQESFLTFANKTDSFGFTIVCTDSKSVERIYPKIEGKKITYGLKRSAQYHVEKIRFLEGTTIFTTKKNDQLIPDFSLKIPGVHNALNALGASILANQIGISWEEIRKWLGKFTGTKRRFELVGFNNDIYLYDDYAHHPTEIQATLAGARSWFPKRRIICIFQPHTFSRTKALFKEFSQCFTDANIAVITDIYASAREAYDNTFSSRILVDSMKSSHSHSIYRSTKEDVVDYISHTARPGDIIITLGAGDIYNWLPNLKRVLQ